MYRISCVKYTNSLPFIYGITNSKVLNKISLSLDTPADCYHKLLNNESDIGLVPVVALRDLKEKYIISPFCIGALSNVRSVILASTSELKAIKRVYLDYQSKTSVQLVRLLAREYWKINPEFIPAEPGFVDIEIPEQSAYVVIGDRAFPFHNKNLKIYDLAEQWVSYSGKPFVFACWVANKPIDKNFEIEFSDALRFGVQSRIPIIEFLGKEHKHDQVDFYEYFFHNINYDLTNDSIEGMELFLNLLQ